MFVGPAEAIVRDDVKVSREMIGVARAEGTLEVPATVERCIEFLRDAVADETSVKSVGENTLCYAGPIDSNSKSEFFEHLNVLAPGSVTLVVRSLGGSVDAGLSMAEALLARSFSIYVYSSCASSCANYLFLPAQQRVVLPNSLVIFHGGLSPGFEERMQGQLEAEQRKRRPDQKLIEGLRSNIADHPGLLRRQHEVLAAAGVAPDFFEFFDDFNALPRRERRGRCQGLEQIQAILFSPDFLAGRGVEVSNYGPENAVAMNDILETRGGSAASMGYCWWN